MEINFLKKLETFLNAINKMILGFRANINQDSHRIFINRLVDFGVSFKGILSTNSNEEYSFIFNDVEDFHKALKIKKSMVEKYDDIPMNKSL